MYPGDLCDRPTVHSESKVPPCSRFAWQLGANVASATEVVRHHAHRQTTLAALF